MTHFPTRRAASCGLVAFAAFAVAARSATAQVVDYQIPLNYNFHGMVHGPTETVNPDNPVGYRGMSDRGLYYDLAEPHAIGSTPMVGATGVTYGLFDTLGYVNTTLANGALWSLDMVHLGWRNNLGAPWETTVPGAFGNRGIYPDWALYDSGTGTCGNCDHTGPQVTTLSTTIPIDARTEIGVLYHASNSNSTTNQATMNVTLGFSDATSATLTLRASDWFGNTGNAANPTTLGPGVVSQTKLLHNVGGTNFPTFRGCQDWDNGQLTTYQLSGAGPNLNVFEGLISVPEMIADGQASIAGKTLTSITFQGTNLGTSPPGNLRAMAVFAATVRSGSPLNANCATPQTIGTGETVGSNTHVSAGSSPATACGGGNDTNALWYSYTAAGNNNVDARTCGSLIDTTIAVYDACSGTEIACNDNGCGSASQVSWAATQNTTYLIRVAGKNNAVGAFTLTVTDPAPTDITLPLQFNWNGICHGPSERTLPDTGASVGSTNENRSNLNGYRAIADRGLLCDGVATDALNFGGTSGYQGMLYNIYSTELQADIVHLGNRNLAAGGLRAFSPPGTTWPAQGGSSTSDNGLHPIWLNNPDHTGPQTSSMTSLNAVFGPNTQIGILYHMSNGGSSFGRFAVRLDFTDLTSVTVDLDATDWFGANSTPMPAAQPGVVLQRKMGGPWRGVQNTDRASDAGTGGRLWVNEGVISSASLQGIGFDPVGRTLSAISFENPRSAPSATGGPVESAFAVFAATMRNPASYNPDFGPTGIGTVSPNMVVVGGTGKINVTVSRGSGSPNNITSVVVDASSIGLFDPLNLNDSGTDGDLVPNDNVWSMDVDFPLSAFPSGYNLPFVITDAQDRTFNGNIFFSLTSPPGAITPLPAVVGSEPLVTISLSTNGQPAQNIQSVTIDASIFGQSFTYPLNDAGQNGDQAAADGIYSAWLRIPLDAFIAPTSLSYVVTDTGNFQLFGFLPQFTPSLPTASVTPSSAFVGGTVLYAVDLELSGISATNITSVTVNAASIGLGGAEPLNDSGANGDAAAGDGVWSANLTIPPGAPTGPTNLDYAVADSLGGFYFGSLPFNVAAIVDIGTLADGLTIENAFLDSGGVLWFQFELTDEVSAANLNFLDIDTEGSNLTGGTTTNDTMIGLYTATGDLVVFDDDDGSNFLSQLTFGATSPARAAFGNSAAYNGRDGTLAAGTYFLAASSWPSTFGATGFNVTTTSTGSGPLSVRFALGDVPAGGPPVDFTDLGVVAADGTLHSSTQLLTSGGVQWFRFVVPQTIVGAYPGFLYLDIDTEGSNVFDTVVGLFRDDGSGTLVTVDDNDGSGSYSQLTYGRGTRPAVLDGLPYDGRDAATLTAGTYYLAVTEATATFGSNFIVFFNTGLTEANVTVNITSGFQTPIIHGPVVNPANNHEYYLLTTGLTWTQAEEFAVNQLQGHLVSISDLDENEWVRFNVLSFDGADRRGWIGLNDAGVEGEFVWSNGDPVVFTHWNAGEPNNGGGNEDYAEMLFSSGEWNDLGNAGTAAQFALVEVGDAVVTIGDLNCDNVIDIADADAMVIALLDPASYAIQYPGCDINRGDVNDDASVDGADLQGLTDLILP